MSSQLMPDPIPQMSMETFPLSVGTGIDINSVAISRQIQIHWKRQASGKF